MSRTRLGLLWLGAVALVWRLAVFVDVRNSPLLSEDAGRGDLALVVARGVMGLAFLLCGAIVLKRRRTRRAALFCLYAFCEAIHWGGPLFAAEAKLQLAIWLGYFTVSAMLAQAAFLHFTLVFPEPWAWARRPAVRFLLYFPIAVAAVMAVLAVLTAPEDASWRDKYFILEALQSNLFAALGLGVLVVRVLRHGPSDGSRSVTGPMAVAAWASVVPWLLAVAIESRAGAVPGGSDIYTLFFVITPIVFSRAVLRHRSAPREDGI